MTEARSFEQVLSDELEHVRVSRQYRKVEQPVRNGKGSCKRALDSGLLGLAISGGGIRSATLALGVLQGLADKGLLRQVDYLSTVSGGGYIGSWFISRLKEHGGPEQVQDIEKMLTQAHASHPDKNDQWPIHFLRQHSNYLTPRLGFFSADVWTMVSTWFRNTILNLAMLVTFLATLLLIPRFAGLGFVSSWKFDPNNLWNGGGTAFLLFAANGFLCRGVSRGPNWTQKMVLWGIMAPFLGGAILLSRWLWFSPAWFHSLSFLWDAVRNFIALAILFASSAWFSGMAEAHGRLRADLSRAERRLSLFLVWLVAAVLPAFVVFLGLRGMAAYLDCFRYRALGLWMTFTWGPPAIVLLLALGVTLQIGLLGLAMELSAREWLARLRAWSVIYSFAWIVLVGGSIYGPWLLLVLAKTHPWTEFGLTTAWLVTTVAGVLSGKSANSSGKPGTLGTGSGGGKPSLEVIARVAPFVFMPVFVLLIALGIHALTGGLAAGNQLNEQTVKLSLSADSDGSSFQVSASGTREAAKPGWVSDPQKYYFEGLQPKWLWENRPEGSLPVVSSPFYLLLIVAGCAALLSARLDLNVFSLHEFYKNRLVRCYLGATRRRGDRHPDYFTGFDPQDDRDLGDFSTNSGSYYGPYPLMNATMNISSGEDLAWQERKSAPFLFSPLYCGYDVGKGNRRMRVGIGGRSKHIQKHSARYAYRRTAELCRGTGIQVGTAMAVSGAAANPNQGYHTSTAVAFLMTVFDVRLGWWLGNPRREDTYRLFSPRVSLIALTSDLFGLTNAKAGFVNLSDGGHFDNMGLYELVRRRCRYIILSDGEQDRNMIFGSLTAAIRNCRMDFGVEIDISLDRIMKNDNGLSSSHCVVGTIKYPEDSGRSDNEKRLGYLLYLKSSLTGDEPADVAGYRAGYSEFPHQSTADQWFTERQFEAYRKLGQHIVETAAGSVRSDPSNREEFFKELQSLWYPPSAHVEKHSARHAELFTGLTLPFGLDDRLEAMDPQVFTAWAERSARLDRWQREGVYRVSALIQFMEMVYTDLNLESKGEQEHPHNKGWLRIFEHWVQQPAFQEAWSRTSKMYSGQFQLFYEDRVRAAKSKV
jgi:hypothetical protein